VRRRREKEKGVPEATAAHTKTEASDGVEQELESQEKLSLPTLDRACRGGALRGLWRKGGRNRGPVPLLSRLRGAPCTVVGMGERGGGCTELDERGGGSACLSREWGFWREAAVGSGEGNVQL
jgi:hypothetical protein